MKNLACNFNRNFLVILLLPILFVGCTSIPKTAIIDQAQTFFDSENDWSVGDGQIFSASEDGLLVGVKLAIKRKRGPKDFLIKLTPVSDGEPMVNQVLATGSISGDKFKKDQLIWYTVLFDQPYPQKKGELLALIMEKPQPSYSSGHGWHELAFQKSDLYDRGYLYYQGSFGRDGIKFDEKRFDLAFATLIVPDFKPYKHCWFSRRNRAIAIKNLCDPEENK